MTLPINPKPLKVHRIKADRLLHEAIYHTIHKDDIQAQRCIWTALECFGVMVINKKVVFQYRHARNNLFNHKEKE